MTLNKTKMHSCIIHFVILALLHYIFVNGVELYVDPLSVIKKNGYPAERHLIQTEDGYILTTYRIPYGRKHVKNVSKIILINHGLIASSGDFIIVNPEHSLGYISAEKGYDVWLMNARGTTYSNKHIRIKEKNKKTFYNFSWHEIGVYDITANIDYILKITNQQQLFYIGHSQGGGTFLIMASMRPEYNKKIRHASLLAPAAILRDINVLYRFLAMFNNLLYTAVQMLEIYDFPFVDNARGVLQTLCKNKYLSSLCIFIIETAAGYSDPAQMDAGIYSLAARVTPSNIAIKQLVHFAQSINTGEFRQFDYGIKENLRFYGSKISPKYNLNNINASITIYAGENDQFVGIEACKLLIKELKNGNLKIISHKAFNHADFLYAIDVVKILYEDMFDNMELY